MQRTPNYNLPQFEPTDKYTLEDYNNAYQIIDSILKQNSDGTTDWNTFKNNGGTIGGDLLVTNNIGVKDIWLNGFIRSSGDITLSPNSGNVFIGSYSKTENGYTKLPNGLILQWGLTKIVVPQGGTKTATVSLPITYPNSCFAVIPTCNYNTTTSNQAWIDAINVGAMRNTSQIIIGAKALDNAMLTQTFEITWIAIGY